MIRVLAALAIVSLVGCGPNYSPDTYATDAAQKANKVEPGVVVGVRPVKISAQGTVGGVTGAAAGGVAGAQVGTGPTSAFAAIGGTLLGGIAGVTAEHVTADTNGFEYIVKKPNGELISVVQKEAKALPLGQKVLVITGNQARIVPDYTLPFEAKAPAAATNVPPAAPSPSTPLPTPGPAPIPPTQALSAEPVPSGAPPHAEAAPQNP